MVCFLLSTRVLISLYSCLLQSIAWWRGLSVHNQHSVDLNLGPLQWVCSCEQCSYWPSRSPWHTARHHHLFCLFYFNDTSNITEQKIHFWSLFKVRIHVSGMATMSAKPKIKKKNCLELTWHWKGGPLGSPTGESSLIWPISRLRFRAFGDITSEYEDKATQCHLHRRPHSLALLEYSSTTNPLDHSY